MSNIMTLKLGNRTMLISVDGDDIVATDIPRGSSDFERMTELLLEVAQVHSLSDDVRVALPSKHPSKDGSPKFVSLPMGLTVIVGDSNKGKSTVARLIARGLDHQGLLSDYVTYVEPRAELSSHTELAERFGAHFLSCAGTGRFMVIDSFKKYAFTAGGGTGKGGIAMEFFNDLCELGIAAYHAGVGLVVVVNPLTSDDAALEFYARAALGSTDGTILCEEIGKFRASSRGADSREWKTVALGHLSAEQLGAVVNLHPSSNTLKIG